MDKQLPADTVRDNGAMIQVGWGVKFQQTVEDPNAESYGETFTWWVLYDINSTPPEGAIPLYAEDMAGRSEEL